MKVVRLPSTVFLAGSRPFVRQPNAVCCRRRRLRLAAEIKDTDFSKIASDAATAIKEAVGVTQRALSEARQSPSIRSAMEDLRDRADALKCKAEALKEALLAKAGEREGSQNGASSKEALKDFNAAVLMEQAEKASVQLKDQAEKAAALLAGAAQGTLEKTKEGWKDVRDEVPGPIKQIAETALEAHSPTAVHQGAVMHDFCLGIPYGASLVLGGLLWFVVVGSVNALRFGAVLGAVLLAASVGSLKAWKQNKSSNPYIAVQAGVTALLFFAEVSRFSVTKAVFPTGLLAVVSFCMFAFYCYVVLSGGNPPSKKNPILAPQ